MKVIRLSTSKKGYGGNIYEMMVDQALTPACKQGYQLQFNLFRLKGFARLLEAPLYLLRNFLFAANSRVFRLRTFQTAFFNLRGRGATIVYHIDSSHSPRAAKFFQDVVEKWFYFWIRRDQHLVVISQFWLEFLQQKGFRNVHLIYCGFDLKQYQVSDSEVEAFKSKYGLSGKILYIGNPQRKKGTHLVYEYLKDAGYTLVCSGEGDLEIPVPQLKLGFREYLCLLKASTAVVTMSQFLEGWNRVAHEAMLLGTPVVGSGFGGMKEVLDGGQQIICTDFSKLVESLRIAERDRERLAIDGYRFAIQFPVERFQKAWVDLVNSLATGPTK
jgi:glycosyltransferase involved in cell wall biosynthesis